MYIKLHHVGIAVSDIEAATRVFEASLGFVLSHSEEVPSEEARVSFFPVGESSLELVETTNPASSLARFITKRGPGVHHLCFEVDDIDQMMKTLEARGVQFTQDSPSAGAHGARVVFIHPRSAGGVLIELRQGPPGG